jgi:LysW-gamma-L-lysine carboxypeptidase
MSPTPDVFALENLDLLRALVSIPSISGQEHGAVAYFVSWMQAHGFEARVDRAGNAVGVLDGGPGPDGAPPRELMLLGHIDTVPGDIPIHIDGGKLYGRGSVDAKGPLTAFALAALAAGPHPGWKLTVIGAVEEEAPSSKGARYVAERYHPEYCIIGEPNHWRRIALGYKGRLLTTARREKTLSHTASPEAGVIDELILFWNDVRAHVEAVNARRSRPWEILQGGVEAIDSGGDGINVWAEMNAGFRLPLDISPEAMRQTLLAVAATHDVQLAFGGGEPAYRSGKNSALVRAFLRAIRAQNGRPGFVVKTGTSDMNVVGPVWNVPIIAYGAGDSALDHTPNEHIVIAEWARSVAVLTHALDGLMQLD